MSRLARRLMPVLLALLVHGAPAQAADAPAFSDWTTLSSSGATGNFEGRPISVTGPIAPGGATDLSFSLFSKSYFDPPLEHSDVLTIVGLNGHSYTMTLGVPVRDPIIHLGSLASTLTFAGSPEITKRSGDPTLVVAGATVTGQFQDLRSDDTTDSNGTIQLHGDFESLSFTAVPVFGGGNTQDGIYFQLGGTLPPGPGNVARPQLSGRPSPPSTLSCTNGEWDRAVAAYTYAWERAPRLTTADDDPNWAPIPGATGASYEVQYADTGSRVRCRVFAADAKTLQGTAVTTSLRIDTATPSTGGLPAISGTLQSRLPLTCNPGEWYGNPDFSYRWLRDGTPIDGATGATYIPVPWPIVIGSPPGDAESQISCEVTGTNDLGSSGAYRSKSVVPVDGIPIALTTSTVILNLGRHNPIGRQAGCSDGFWRFDYNYGTPEFHHEYQWMRNGFPIAGATGATYVTTVEDLGTWLSCSVSANNPLGRAELSPGRSVLVPLPGGTQNAQVLRAGGSNRYDPVNLMALSDDYLKVVTEEIIPSLGRAVAAETRRCGARTDVPQSAPDFDDTQFPLSDIQRCQVLLHEREYVEVTQEGVEYQGLRCRPCDLGFVLPSVDPAKAPSLDPVLAERLEPMTPDRVLWDVDGDGRTDATCPGSAPVLRTLLNGGRWDPRAVIVAPDSAATEIYGLATTNFNHATASDAAKFGAGKLRSGQPFSCKTSMAPPANVDTGPCVTDGTIGRVHVTGNLCPINVRNLSPEDIDAVPDDLQPLLAAFSESQGLRSARTRRSLIYASTTALRSVRAEVPRTAAQLTLSSTYINTVSSVASRGLYAGEAPALVAAPITAMRRAGVAAAKANFAADQIYISKGPLKVNGVDIAPRSGIPVVLVPSDVGEAFDSSAPGSLRRMTLSARQATRSLGPIPLTGAENFTAPISDAPSSAAALLPRVNLDALLAKVGKIELGPFKLRGSADVKLEDDGTATLSAKAIFPGLKDPVTGSEPRVDVTLHGDRDGNLSLSGVHLHVESAVLGGVQLRGVDLTYDGGLDLQGEIVFPPVGQGLKINRFRLNADGGFQELDVSYLSGAGQGIPLGGGIFLTRLRGKLDMGPPSVIEAGTTLSVGPSSGGGCPTVGADATFRVTFAPHVFAFDASADLQLICIPLATITFHADQTGFVSLAGKFGYSFGPLFARGAFGAQVKWPDWQAEVNGEVGIHVPLLGDLSEGGAFVISNYGLAGCAKISIPIIGTVRGGAGVRFPGGHFPGSLGELISNVHLFTGCDLSAYKSLPSISVRGAGIGSSSFTLPSGSRGVALSFDGANGAPLVRLRSPSGKVLDFAATPEGARLPEGVGFVLPDEGRTVVLLGKPEGGQWMVEPAEGSAAVVGIRKADILPPVGVTGRVLGSGVRRRLVYSVTPQRGQVVRFAERAQGALHVLKTVRTGGHGRVTFTVAEATGRRRTIVAQVLQDGLPRQTLTLARFSAPNPAVGRVTRLRVRRSGTKATITWARAPQATSYGVSVRDGDGGVTAYAPRPGTRRVVVRGLGRRVGLRVTVIALSARGRRGPRATAVLSASVRRGR